MNRATARPQLRLNGWHVLAGFVLFFAVIAAVNAAMIMRAYGTYPGEVSTTPYEDGLGYDRMLQAREAQAELGWRTGVAFARPDVLEFTAFDRAGAPIVFARIDAALERPATTLGRRNIRFVESAPGAYRADVAGLRGAWDLTLNARDGAGRRFALEQRLIAP
jgi:nitrogen fixation protein FixH